MKLRLMAIKMNYIWIAIRLTIKKFLKQRKEKFNMELKDTIKLMTSEDYKERFLAEYWQVKIRYDKLKNMVDNWDNLNFKPTCEKFIYKLQLNAMSQYLNILENRAIWEKVDLFNR
jgi:hypothetical protein